MIGIIPIIFAIQLYLANWTIKTDNLISWGIIANVFGVTISPAARYAAGRFFRWQGH